MSSPLKRSVSSSPSGVGFPLLAGLISHLSTWHKDSHLSTWHNDSHLSTWHNGRRTGRAVAEAAQQMRQARRQEAAGSAHPMAAAGTARVDTTSRPIRP